MIDLKDWIVRNIQRPLAYAFGTILSLQIGYFAFLAHDRYTTQVHLIDRLVETSSLGVQQGNRPLIESTLITGLRSSDAATVALCLEGKAELLYPPGTEDPCRMKPAVFHWTIRRKAIGLAAHEFVFVIDGFGVFAPLAVLLTISFALSLVVFWILSRARSRFLSQILEPLREGLNEEKPLAVRELDELRRRNQEHNELSRRQAVSEAIFVQSVEVAHDIKSPIAALESIFEDLDQLPEKQRVLVRAAIRRIGDIANNLLQKNKESIKGGDSTASECGVGGSTSNFLLSSLIEPLISEKRFQFRSRLGVEIDARLDASSYGLFAKVNAPEFKRVLSNLINNAAEAIVDKGTVRLRLTSKVDLIRIEVQDTGIGISPEILARLGQRGETHGKAGGTGLGLYHARTTVTAWGGNLELFSEVGRGTTVVLTLPKASPSEWFVSLLELNPRLPVVVLDDDTGIHQLWQARFDSLRPASDVLDVHHFFAPEDLRAWVKADIARARSTVYLADYELLGNKDTGLDLVEELGLGERAILVTSRFEEKHILESCMRLKVRMIPKGLAALVPIQIDDAAPVAGPASKRWDAVLIDDDELAHMTWEESAAKYGKKFLGFSTISQFLKQASLIDRKSKVYVDVKLADGVRGDQESLRIHELGFTEIYLETGHNPERFSALKHLRGVVGKGPPWST